MQKQAGFILGMVVILLLIASLCVMQWLSYSGLAFKTTSQLARRSRAFYRAERGLQEEEQRLACQHPTQTAYAYPHQTAAWWRAQVACWQRDEDSDIYAIHEVLSRVSCWQFYRVTAVALQSGSAPVRLQSTYAKKIAPQCIVSMQSLKPGRQSWREIVF